MTSLVHIAGILIWELVTNHLPWSLSNCDSLLIVAAIADNRTPEIPEDVRRQQRSKVHKKQPQTPVVFSFQCIEDLKQLMLGCWRPEAERRPSFEEIICMLKRAQKQPASMKQQNVKQLNSRESLKKIRNPMARIEEVLQLRRLIQEKSLE